MANGGLAAANAVSPVPLSAYFASPEWTGVWQRRSKQVEEDPASAAWVTGVIWDVASQYGFTEVGEQWDDEDGLEIIYEVDAQPR